MGKSIVSWDRLDLDGGNIWEYTFKLVNLFNVRIEGCHKLININVQR